MAIGDKGPANKTPQKNPNLDSRSAAIAGTPVRKVSQPVRHDSGDASYPTTASTPAGLESTDPSLVDKPFRGC